MATVEFKAHGKKVSFKASVPRKHKVFKGDEPTGTCKRIKAGKNGTIELCKTGRGKTGYRFKKGSFRRR